MVPISASARRSNKARRGGRAEAADEIAAKIAELRAKGAPYLAHAIEAAGPRHGPHVTNAAPGYSWHQWGEAMDCSWLTGGKAEWSTDAGGAKNGYRSMPIRRPRTG